MTVPLTGVAQSIDMLTLLVAYFFVRYHIKRAGQPVINSVVGDLQKFMLTFAIFNFGLAAPHVLLFFAPDLFSPVMAWAYSAAHVFVFASLMYLNRMAIKIVPGLARWDAAVVAVWVVIAAVLTYMNVAFVTLQHQPYFDAASGLTKFNIPSFIGIAFGNISLLGYLPPIALFTYSGFRSNGLKRARSLLIALGMLITMVGGPLHAIATTWQIYVLADGLNALGLAIVAVGVALQIGQSLSVKPSQTSAAKG